MPIVYLEPEDLSPLQAARVLDFLNRASSPEQLARDIEFPDELDIGPHLARRLLDARTALGGRYSAIAQVRAVRLIGPERFTEICVAALGLEPRRWVELFYAASPLAQSRPRSESGLVATLELLPQPAWIGQTLTLTVRVADLGGTPVPGSAVTVHAGGCRLLWMYGWQRIEGEAVTVLTGADGSAALELSRPPAEPVSDVQQAALETALAAIDIGATDPFKAEAGLRALAASYLAERSYNLRRAIDIHVQERQATLLGGVNAGGWRLAWPVETALLQADVHAGSGGGSALARAVAVVQWKNWVGAWVEFFGDVLRERGRLDEQFAGLVAGARDGGVVNEMLARAQGFVAAQDGRTAVWLGRRTVEQAMARAAGADLANVEPAARAALLTQGEIAAREVTPTSLGSYTLVKSVTRPLDSRLQQLGSIDLGAIARIDGVAERVDTQAARVDAVAAQMAQKSAQLDASLTSFDSRYAQFNTDLTRFNQTLPSTPIHQLPIETPVHQLPIETPIHQLPIEAPIHTPIRAAAPRKAAAKRPARKRGAT